MPFYAVRKGFHPGIYLTWDECKAQVDRFKGAQFKKFATREEAQAFAQSSAGPTPAAASQAPSKSSSASCKSPATGGLGGASAAADAGSGPCSRTVTSGGAAGGRRPARPAPYLKPTRAHREPPPAETAASGEPASGEPVSKELDSMKRGVDSARRELAALRKQISRYSRCETAPAGRPSGAASPQEPPPPAAAPDQFVVDADGYLNVWTDGACSFNGQRGARAGVGVWFNRAHRLNVSAPVDGPATNNNAEIQAARVALEVAAGAGHRRVLVHTDSRFVIDCATRWLAGWRRNGWRLSGGGPVKNRAQLEGLARAMEGAEIKWNYVPGHSGVSGNEEADRLAVAGAARYEKPVSSDP